MAQENSNETINSLVESTSWFFEEGMNVLPQITVQNLDHLGLVAGLIDEIGVVEKINQLVGEQLGEILLSGYGVAVVHTEIICAKNTVELRTQLLLQLSTRSRIQLCRFPNCCRQER